MLMDDDFLDSSASKVQGSPVHLKCECSSAHDLKLVFLRVKRLLEVYPDVYLVIRFSQASKPNVQGREVIR